MRRAVDSLAWVAVLACAPAFGVRAVAAQSVTPGLARAPVAAASHPEVTGTVARVLDSAEHPWLTWPDISDVAPLLRSLYATEPDGLFWFHGEQPRPVTGEVVAGLEPHFPHYARLRAALGRYTALAAAGEPPLAAELPTSRGKVEPGDRWAGVAALAARLEAFGDLSTSEGPGGRGTDAQIRQKPGPGNSLGLVKFIFPNSENIYMHGTPAQQLFSRARRDFSHGCIRLEDPVALARWVLRDQPEWTVARIEAAMKADHPTRVDLSAPLNVVLFYVTAHVGSDGVLRFAEDIYGFDQTLDAALRQGYPYPRERPAHGGPGWDQPAVLDRVDRFLDATLLSGRD